MNGVVERPTSLIKPPLPVRRQHHRIQSDKPVGASFNRKVKLFESNGQDGENAEETDSFAPLRRRQPKAITPDQKRWTQIETSENTSLWTPPPNTPTRSRQKTLPPTPSPRLSNNNHYPIPAPRLLSPTTPTPAPRLSSPVAPNRTFVINEKADPKLPSPVAPSRTFITQDSTGDGVKKRPKPKPRARSGIPDSILDKDVTEYEKLKKKEMPKSLYNHYNSDSSFGHMNGGSSTYLDREFSKSKDTHEPSEFRLSREFSTSDTELESPASPSKKEASKPYNTLPYKLKPYRSSTSTDSVIYANNTSRHSQKMAYYFSKNNPPPSSRKPRPRTEFTNVAYGSGDLITGTDDKSPMLPRRPRASTDAKTPELPRRPRASTDVVNGRTEHDDNDDDKRFSVLELAQSFGELRTNKERPNTLISLRNGHSDYVMKSNPDLLSDESDDTIEEEPISHVHKVLTHQKRLSKSLSDFNLIDMPEMDPYKFTAGGKLNSSAPLRPPTGPSQPDLSGPGKPSKPKRTYEHDAYVLRKSLKGLPNKKEENKKPVVPQSQSAVPHVNRTVTPLVLPSSINAKRRHDYDDVPADDDKEEGKPEREYVLVYPSPSSDSSPELNKKSDERVTSPRPKSTTHAINKPPRRGKLQRSNRIERSASTDDILRDKYKISGEYANPEVALLSKRRKEKPREKPVYSETYIHRSSSDEGLSSKTKPPVEDSAGYTVPGSHLWNTLPEKKEEEEKNSRLRLALSNLSGEKLIADEALNNINAAPPHHRIRRFSSRRRTTGQRSHPQPRSPNESGCPPSPSFLTHRKSKFTEDMDHHHHSHFRQRSKHVHMRHKIQSAFSHKKASKVEEDTLSQTSEDSDIDVNDTVLKKRLTHVRAVRRRTSAYCSLEWYRKTMQYSKLYEYVVVVSLQFNKETRRHEPCEIRRFPYEISDSQNDKLRAIPLFCFPDAFKWAKVDSYNSESYSFVLTSVDGSRLYGYNRRLLPPGDGPRLPEVYCVMSPIGCAPVYNELLDEIEKRRQISMQAVEVLLRTARETAFPRPGERLKIKIPSQPITKPLIIHRPTDSRLEQMNFECLFESLDVAKVIQVFASLLLERRVVMCSSKLSKLSSCSQAIAALLYPFAWQHVYVPVLPEKLIDMCCSPTPYIMGMLSLCIPKLDEMPGIDEVIVVDLDSRDFYFVVGDEETILPKKLYVGLQRALSFAGRGSAENINDVAELADSDQKNAMISEAFIHFFVETCGHYSNHFNHQYDGTLKFDREGFLNAVKSRSTRRFLEVFTETQMFSLFIQEKESESEGICQGMFERRVKLFEREKASNSTFGTKMKKIVKDSGTRLAETAKDVKERVKLSMTDQV